MTTQVNASTYRDQRQHIAMCVFIGPDDSGQCWYQYPKNSSPFKCFKNVWGPTIPSLTPGDVLLQWRFFAEAYDKKKTSYGIIRTVKLPAVDRELNDTLWHESKLREFHKLDACDDPNFQYILKRYFDVDSELIGGVASAQEGLDFMNQLETERGGRGFDSGTFTPEGCKRPIPFYSLNRYLQRGFAKLTTLEEPCLAK